MEQKSNLRRNNKAVLTLTKVLPLIGIKDSSKAFAFETVGKTGVLLSTSWGAGAKKLTEVLEPIEGKKICISGASAGRQGLSADQCKELNYYPLTLGGDWQAHIVDEGSDTDAFDAWLSLTKVALLPDWSIICVKGVVYELINSGFQLEDGGSIALVHVADETDILQRIEEGDEVKAYLVSVSTKFQNLKIDEETYVTVKKGNGICTSPTKLRRAF